MSIRNPTRKRLREIATEITHLTVVGYPWLMRGWRFGRLVRLMVYHSGTGDLGID